MSYNFILPKKDKAYWCEPKYKEWINSANRNLINKQKWNFYVCDKKGSDFIENARREILNASYAFCAAKNIPVKQKDPFSYIFATGHQAVFYHSSVWLKNFLINKYSENDNITGLNLWIDYEEGCHETFVVPYYSGNKLARKNIPLNVPVCHNVISSLPPPTDNLWLAFTNEIKNNLKTIPQGIALNNFEKYLESAKPAFKISENLSEFIALSRRYYEQSSKTIHYLELPVSYILKTTSFLTFFMDIVNKIDGFSLIYNHVLDTYRAQHMIKNNANPFPNLRIHDNLFELPFWTIMPSGQRAGLWYDKNKNYLLAKGETIIKLNKNNDANIEILKKAEHKIVTKAATLMVFFRVFAADFFLHGAGGAKYDEITDQIIQKFYNIIPPVYGAATANLYIDTPKVDYDEKEKFEVEKTLIQIKHNPQKFIPEEILQKPEIKELVKEKEHLVKKIKIAPLDDKKIIADRIKKSNEKLETIILPMKKELEAKFEKLSEKESQHKTAIFKEYPFCFYKPENLANMAELIKNE